MNTKTETPPILPFGRQSPGALVGGVLLSIYTTWPLHATSWGNAKMKSSMDKTFLEQQKNLAIQRLESFGDKYGPGKQAIVMVSEYLSSLLHPEDFTDAQKEDLRKLALEFGYKEDTDFSKWTPTFPTPESGE